LYVRTEFGSVHIPEKVTASQAPRRPRALKVGVHSIKPESLAYSWSDPTRESEYSLSSLVRVTDGVHGIPLKIEKMLQVAAMCWCDSVTV